SAIYPEAFTAVFDVEAADLNADGFLDLVITSFADFDRIYLGDGDGTFTFLALLKDEMNNSCVNCLQIQDVDGDQVPDIILGYNSGDTRLDIFKGRGDGTFETPAPVDYGSNTPIAVKLNDVDNDGDLDILVGQSQGGNLYLTRGNGTTSFPPMVQLSTTTNSRCYGIGFNDFDGDGNVDIVFSQDNNGVVGFLAGNGDGSFAPQVALDGGTTYTTTSIDVGDVNGDGILDFVMGVADGPSLLFIGQ
ncbi:MAG: VCBS repeat-containing protein, partial [Deltaproteobacteria bacterium]|nr:VCBS repeat-containing protein [Deltaproteobacteria bacterium]